MVNGGNLCFATLELTIGLKQVIDRRHEIAMLHSSRQIARKSGKKAQLPIGIAHHQYAQHLALTQFGLPIGTAIDILHHLCRSSLAQRVRHIVERKSEAFGQTDVRHIGHKSM